MEAGSSADDKEPRDIVVIHETNGRKYLEALVRLEKTGRIRSLTFAEASVVWKLLHSLVRERRGLVEALGRAAYNLRFRIGLPAMHDKIVLVCLPPWDFRFALLAFLRRRNVVVYFTSWPHWQNGRVPRRFGPLTGFVRDRWLRILHDPAVRQLAVTSAARAELSATTGREVLVIPHVVSDVFFERRARHTSPFRLLFSGDLVAHRGLATVKSALELLEGEAIVLDIIGDGPMRQFAQELASSTGGTWYGRISQRERYADIVASASVVVAPSIRTARWEELFGMALLEAMACGVPCITSEHVGPKGFIAHDVSGAFIPERDAQALASWVRRLLHDERKWNAMSEAARTRALESRLPRVASLWDNFLSSI